MPAQTLNLSSIFDAPEVNESRTAASNKATSTKTVPNKAAPMPSAPDAMPASLNESETGLAADNSAMYRRLDKRSTRPAWMVPAAAAIVLVAGASALAFTLAGSHHAQPPLAGSQVATNTATAPTQPEVAAQPTQSAPAEAAPVQAQPDQGAAL